MLISPFKIQSHLIQLSLNCCKLLAPHSSTTFLYTKSSSYHILQAPYLLNTLLYNLYGITSFPWSNPNIFPNFLNGSGIRL